MLPNHPQICLYQPEIPQNTGNIGRLSAATQCRLHLITPFGFSGADKNLRRAGLDYWPFLDLEIHSDLDLLLERFDLVKVAFFSAKATQLYTEMPSDTQLLVFGRETSGLPVELREKYPQSFYRIPIYHSGVRSLNLSNAVALTVYHRLAQEEGNSWRS